MSDNISNNNPYNAPDFKSRELYFHIGMRNVKTALSATLCALIYFFWDRNPTFACIGTVFGMGNDMDNSFINGWNRLSGAIFGGVLGIILFPFYLMIVPDGGFHLSLLIFVFLGTLLLVLACLFFECPGSIQPGSVVLFIVLFNTPVETYISYATNRMFDTAFGVALSLVINYLFPRDRVIKILNKIGLHKNRL